MTASPHGDDTRHRALGRPWVRGWRRLRCAAVPDGRTSRAWQHASIRVGAWWSARVSLTQARGTRAKGTRSPTCGGTRSHHLRGASLGGRGPAAPGRRSRGAGKETWLLVHRREPERTYRTCRCVEHRQGRGGRGASNRCRRFVRSSGSHPWAARSRVPLRTVEGARGRWRKPPALGQTSRRGPSARGSTRIRRSSGRNGRPSRGHPAHRARPGAHQVGARSDSLRSGVAHAVRRTSDERGARFTVRRSGTTRISRLRARGRQKSTGHTLDAR